MDTLLIVAYTFGVILFAFIIILLLIDKIMFKPSWCLGHYIIFFISLYGLIENAILLYCCLK